MSVIVNNEGVSIRHEIELTDPHISFITKLTPAEVEEIFQWRQHRYDMEDISVVIDDVFTNDEMHRFMNNTEENRMNFYHETATIKREIMDKENIPWREASEQAIKRLKEQYL